MQIAQEFKYKERLEFRRRAQVYLLNLATIEILENQLDITH
jgi:hypothetical protein